jgi:hypothetical protein
MPRNSVIPVRHWVALVATAGMLLAAEGAVAACERSSGDLGSTRSVRDCCVGTCRGCCATPAASANKAATRPAYIDRALAAERGLKPATCPAGNGCFCRRDGEPGPAEAPTQTASGASLQLGVASRAEPVLLPASPRRFALDSRAAGSPARAPLYLQLSHLVI